MTDYFYLTAEWEALLTGLGVSTRNVLRRAQLPEGLFSQVEVKLRTLEYFRVWNALAAESRDPSLPSRIADRMVEAGSHPAVFAALCCSNLASALHRLAAYWRRSAPMIFEVEHDANSVVATLEWTGTCDPPPRALGHVEAALLVRIAQTGSTHVVQPLRVEMPHDSVSFDVLARALGVPIHGGDYVSVRFSNVDADRPFVGPNESMWARFPRSLRRGDDNTTATTEEQVRSSLLELLPSGRTSIGDVALWLGSSRRTLQRRLKHEGTKYQTILRSVRIDLAHHYLEDTALSHPDIAFLLGFESPNSFIRAFCTWTGRSPRKARGARVVSA